MQSYKYLIIGGGMTADAAVAGIRQVDHGGPIGLIGAESEPPYNRPPLSKGLWKGKPVESIWRKDADNDAALHLGRQALHVDSAARQVADDAGMVYQYEKLLLATGGTPRRIPNSPPGVIYFRTVDDYTRLRQLAAEKERFAVIGGGFIGSEIAAALAMNGKQVAMIFPDRAISGSMFPSDLANSLNEYYRGKGVDVRNGARVDRIDVRDGQLAVQLASSPDRPEQEVAADVVVAGLGIQPNLELAEQLGLTIGNGIRVDSALRTSQPDIFAAGDVAEFFNPALETFLRVEHEDNANTMGEMAGRSMAGDRVSYDHLPFFYSDLFDLGYEAVGELDSSLDTVADWKEEFREGVVYYLRDGLVRGVLFWNVWNRVDAARQMIAERRPFHAGDLRGRLTGQPQHA